MGSMWRWGDRSRDEVKDRVEARWGDDQLAERLAAKAAEMVDKLKAGTPFAEVAAANGLKVETQSHIKRAPAAEPLSVRLVDAAFRTPHGAPGSAEGPRPSQPHQFVVTD